MSDDKRDSEPRIILTGADAWIPSTRDSGYAFTQKSFEERSVASPTLTAFLADQKAEIDGMYETMQARITEHVFAGMSREYVPPKRWSAQWWRSKRYAVQSALTRARRRVGMWIGGIEPWELERD